MECWRIVKTEFAATAFTGEGAALFPGRWNSAGTRIIYAGETRSLAVLEMLVHTRRGHQPALSLISIRFPKTPRSIVKNLPLERLPENWRDEPPWEATRAIGDAWVSDAHTAVLAVPSAVIPQERNLLLNPAHPDFAQIEIGLPERFSLDARLA